MVHALLLSTLNYAVYRAFPPLSDALRPILSDIAPHDYLVTRGVYEAAGDTVRQYTTPTDSVLYLTDGSATYFAHRPSHSRYFLPLPVQRARPGTELRESDLYRATLSELSAYRGPVIVLESWFGIAEHPPLLELTATYVRAYYGRFADERTIEVLVSPLRPSDPSQ